MVYSAPNKRGIVTVGQSCTSRGMNGWPVEHVIEVNVKTMSAWHVVYESDARGKRHQRICTKSLKQANKLFTALAA